MLGLLLACPPFAQAPPAAERVDPARIELRLSDRLADVSIQDGQVIVATDQGPQAVDAETFLRALEARQRRGESRGWLFQLFDITGYFGLAWIAIGFGGQLLFTGRMIVQWLASEKHRRSVVPPAFWWMSLIGASMLLAYFTWRRDIVGIFGQATGWFIYARNLWLIHHQHHQHPPAPTESPTGPLVQAP
jgi:lipid-A-disaccharide synthase-like uncharacterized protein